MELWIIALIICDTALAADTESFIHISANSQHTGTTEVITELIERLDGLTKYVQQLTRLRERDVHEMTRLNTQLENMQVLHDQDEHVMTQMTTRIDELERLRVKDLQVTKQLTKRVTELERKYDNDVPDVLQQTPHLLHVNTSGNSLDVGFVDVPADVQAENRSSKSVQGHEQIPIGYPQRHVRVSQSYVLAFHVILSQSLNGLATNQAVKYDKLVTSTGGADYSTNTGAFTCTQAGVHVFSWSVAVDGQMYMYTDLVRNNVGFGKSVAGDTSNRSASSLSAVLHLDVGDEVWVRVTSHSSQINLDSGLSTFMGFRLG